MLPALMVRRRSGLTYYAGTMGQLQRDGINRLRQRRGVLGQEKTICTAPAYAGWNAGTGAGWG